MFRIQQATPTFNSSPSPSPYGRLRIPPGSKERKKGSRGRNSLKIQGIIRIQAELGFGDSNINNFSFGA